MPRRTDPPAGAPAPESARVRKTQAATAGAQITAGSVAPSGLAEYQQMRDFATTPEPSGDTLPESLGRPCFCIQFHQATAKHYDFRLEIDGVLKSWAIPKGPSYDPKDKRLAMMTEDHPLAYALFEGVIPDGHYGGGPVLLWDLGTVEYVPDEKTHEPDPAVNLAKGKLVFRLSGSKLSGEWTLVKTKGFGGRENSWLLIKHRDVTAQEGYDVVAALPRSVASDRTIDEIRAAG